MILFHTERRHACPGSPEGREWELAKRGNRFRVRNFGTRLCLKKITVRKRENGKERF